MAHRYLEKPRWGKQMKYCLTWIAKHIFWPHKENSKERVVDSHDWTKSENISPGKNSQIAPKELLENLIKESKEKKQHVLAAIKTK